MFDHAVKFAYFVYYINNNKTERILVQRAKYEKH